MTSPVADLDLELRGEGCRGREEDPLFVIFPFITHSKGNLRPTGLPLASLVVSTGLVLLVMPCHRGRERRIHWIVWLAPYPLGEEKQKFRKKFKKLRTV